MIGWAWEGTAGSSAGCGVSDTEEKAKQAAGDWLRANPDGEAVLSRARLADGTATLCAFWALTGPVRHSRRARDGRITWAQVPSTRAAGAG